MAVSGLLFKCFLMFPIFLSVFAFVCFWFSFVVLDLVIFFTYIYIYFPVFVIVVTCFLLLSNAFYGFLVFSGI